MYIYIEYISSREIDNCDRLDNVAREQGFHQTPARVSTAHSFSRRPIFIQSRPQNSSVLLACRVAPRRAAPRRSEGREVSKSFELIWFIVTSDSCHELPRVSLSLSRTTMGTRRGGILPPRNFTGLVTGDSGELALYAKIYYWFRRLKGSQLAPIDKRATFPLLYRGFLPDRGSLLYPLPPFPLPSTLPSSSFRLAFLAATIPSRILRLIVPDIIRR